MPTLLVCRVRTARQKAIEAAAMEMLCLLRDLSPERCRGGPFADQAGVFWIQIAEASLHEAMNRFSQLGYTCAVDRLELLGGSQLRKRESVRWRKRYYRVVRVYEEDDSLLRAQAPDRREFVILGHDGRARTVRGYRGDGTRSGRRGLPVCDARLATNLARPAGPGAARFLDPFGGAGGIALEALACGFSVFTTDIDAIVSPGLQQLGACHQVVDARRLPFPDASFHAIATEPPYHEGLGDLVVEALGEMQRVLAPAGRMAIFCADWQTEFLISRAEALGLSKFFESPINRKGTACRVLAWEKGQVFLRASGSASEVN